MNTESFIIRTESTHPDNVTREAISSVEIESQERDFKGCGHLEGFRERSNAEVKLENDLELNLYRGWQQIRGNLPSMTYF